MRALPLFGQKALERTRPLMTRADCIDGRAERMAGRELCDRVKCRYHIIGGIALWSKKHDEAAVESMRAWLEGEFTGHCALDIADLGGASDSQIAKMMSIDIKAMTRRCAEALYEYRQSMPASWLSERRLNKALTRAEFVTSFTASKKKRKPEPLFDNQRTNEQTNEGTNEK